MVFTSFGEEAQEIWFRSPDRFSSGGTRGVGNETSFLVAFTILCVNVNAKQLNRTKSQGTGNEANHGTGNEANHRGLGMRLTTGDWE